METITIPLERFELDRFVAAYEQFHGGRPGGAACVMERSGDTPVPLSNIDTDEIVRGASPDRGPIQRMVLDGQKLVFLDFHEAFADTNVRCLDGDTYDDDEAPSDSDRLDIGVADSYGYVVEVRDGNVNLYSGLYDGSSGPFPTVELQHKNGIFDQRMTTFAMGFVRG